jgi:hypothetical protein
MPEAGTAETAPAAPSTRSGGKHECPAGRRRQPASCKIGTQDVSRWLVENGWAEAAAGSALADAGAKAKQDKKGLYGGDPRKNAPSTIEDDPGQDDAPDPL